MCILCARAYYVLFEWEQYKDNLLSVFQINKGGLAIYGGIIGGLAGALVYARVKRLKLRPLIDMAIPYVLLAQAIGRWGNFFNGEAYGQVITDPSLQFFPYAVHVDGQWYQAAFFYESIADLIGFLILYFTRKRWRSGDGLPLYMIVYGIPRFLIEGLRSDSLYVGGTGIRVSQLLSAVLVIIGCLYFGVRFLNQARRNRHE